MRTGVVEARLRRGAWGTFQVLPQIFLPGIVAAGKAEGAVFMLA